MAKVIKWSIFSRKNFQWQKIGLWIILLQHIETQIFFNVNFQKSYEKFFIGIRTKKRFRGRYGFSKGDQSLLVPNPSHHRSLLFF